MIVKVQTHANSVTDTLLGAPCTVRNQDGTVTRQMLITSPVRAIMKGRTKAFFHATYEKKALEITGEAPWQSW